MVNVSFVECERGENGEKILRHDPTGRVAYTVFILYIQRAMTPREIKEAGKYIETVLKAADYANQELANSVKQPIACYVVDTIHMKLVLFGDFDAREIMHAIASGRRNLNI